MDALTERLHEAAEALPGASAAAEQARRVRRRAAGSAAAGLLAVLALGVGVLGGGARPELAPAGPASRAWASPAGSVFTADPLMPKAGWVAMTRNQYGTLRDLDAPAAKALADDESILMTADIPRPLDCIADPYTLDVDEVYGAAFLQPGNHLDAMPLSGRLNEYVLWFADPSDAKRAFTGLHEQFQQCRTRPDSTHRVDNSYLAYEEALTPEVEEQFTAEINRVPNDAGADGYGYGLGVARLGSLVVVHESLEASGGRPALTLYALMIHALDRLSPTVTPTR